MGAALVPQIVAQIQGDLDRAVFSFIPNTAETAYHGMVQGLQRYRRMQVRNTLLECLQNGSLSAELIDDVILRKWPRVEKIAHKDIKLRTFISQEQNRLQLASHVYDITYGEVQQGDALIVIDDSIVRGTTLKQSILKMLARTHPKQIIVASTAPQIRYPDCYGIDMAEIGKFIAFQAVIKMLKDSGRQGLIDSVASKCRVELAQTTKITSNPVQLLYEQFSTEEISAKISEMVYPETQWKGQLTVIFQSVADLHACLQETCGDWYFTGNYPTPGGYELVCRSFVHWYEGKSGRAYDL
jgi:amidophosphoribosyltransferase